jgi:SpoVK/Ycf46/Vps4 family AAA+-type ATPase
MPQPDQSPIIHLTPDELRRILRRRERDAANGAECELPPDAAVADDHRNPRRGDAGASPEVGVIVQPEARHALDQLVLGEDTKADILAGLRSIEQRDALESVWSLSAIQPQRGRCILNFYGDPGTGKTRAALAIALRLGKPLYQVDYASVISKYLGDTAKHIQLAFARAQELGAVLFFDEADSLLSRRVDIGESCATSINQNRNVLMQELDRFDGVVVMTTNLFGNYDPALLRRIARHIEFKLPDQSQRQRLFELHLPSLSPNVNSLSPIGGEGQGEGAAHPHYGPIDLNAVARASLGLSGGDIFNVCLNAIQAASASDNPADWRLTQAHLLAEVRKIKASKQTHGGKTAARGPIGFTAPDRDLEQ